MTIPKSVLDYIDVQELNGPGQPRYRLHVNQYGHLDISVYHEWTGEVFGPPNCPTWNDVTECKCMLALEDQ